MDKSTVNLFLDKFFSEQDAESYMQLEIKNLDIISTTRPIDMEQFEHQKHEVAQAKLFYRCLSAIKEEVQTIAAGESMNIIEACSEFMWKWEVFCDIHTADELDALTDDFVSEIY